MTNAIRTFIARALVRLAAFAIPDGDSRRDLRGMSATLARRGRGGPGAPE